MNDLLLARIELLDGSRVMVTPTRPNASYQHIYRAALGVEWNNEKGAFLSPSNYMLESRRDCSAIENMGYVVAALKDEMGLQPLTDAHTSWVGFNGSLKAETERMFGARQGVPADRLSTGLRQLE